MNQLFHLKTQLYKNVHSFLEYFRFSKMEMLIHGIICDRGGSRAAATSKMERIVIIVNGFQSLTIITKRSILVIAATLDPPLLRCCRTPIAVTTGGFELHNYFVCKRFAV